MVQPFRKILSPVDFDENSLAAVEYAAYLAQQEKGTVALLHVVPTDELHLHREVYRPQEGGGANAVWAEKVAKEKLHEIARERLTGGIPYEILTRVGDAATTVLETAHAIRADVVVMATCTVDGAHLAALRWGRQDVLELRNVSSITPGW